MKSLLAPGANSRLRDFLGICISGVSKAKNEKVWNQKNTISTSLIASYFSLGEAFQPFRIGNNQRKAGRPWMRVWWGSEHLGNFKDQAGPQKEATLALILRFHTLGLMGHLNQATTLQGGFPAVQTEKRSEQVALSPTRQTVGWRFRFLSPHPSKPLTSWRGSALARQQQTARARN